MFLLCYFILFFVFDVFFKFCIIIFVCEDFNVEVNNLKVIVSVWIIWVVSF